MYRTREGLIERLVVTGQISKDEAALLRGGAGVPWELPGLARDLGLDPDLTVGYPSKFAHCKGYGHVWESIPMPVGVLPGLDIIETARCLCCLTLRMETPDYYGTGRLFRFVYEYPKDWDQIPKGLTRHDHRTRWVDLREQVEARQKPRH